MRNAIAVLVVAALALPLPADAHPLSPPPFPSPELKDAPRIEELARTYLIYPPGQRRPLLVLLWRTAEPEDVPLLWSLLSGSSPDEVEETVAWIALGPLGADRIPLLADLYRKSEERLQRELIRTWIRSTSISVLEPLLRRLLVEAEQTGGPSPRKELLQVLLNARAEDFPVLWQRLRKAEAWEADLLVEWFHANPIRSFDSMVDLYRSARTEEEKDRALWAAAVGSLDSAVYLGGLLAVTGDLGEGPRRLHRLARAFHSCPNAKCRSRMVDHISGAAWAGDLPVMRELLRASTVDEARSLSRWFSRHPSPEAVPHFRERLGPIPEDLWIPNALAAAGDPEVLDWALKDLRRQNRDHSILPAMNILSHSPLPAAAEQIRQILAEGGNSLYLLMYAFVDLDNRSPYRWWFFEEALKSGEHRLAAIERLRYLAERGEETAERLLAEAGS